MTRHALEFTGAGREHVLHLRRRLPAAGRVREDERQDDRQGTRRLLFPKTLPDPGHVDQHAQRHVRIVRALVLEQQVEARAGLRIVAQRRREQQVAMPRLEVGTDEGPRLAGHGVPVDGLDQRARQPSPKQLRRRLRPSERRLEDRVVRRRRHGSPWSMAAHRPWGEGLARKVRGGVPRSPQNNGT